MPTTGIILGYNNILIAYVIPKLNMQINNKDLSTFLDQQGLPKAAHPKVLILIDHFPITLNGKIDTKALPKPNFEAPTTITQNNHFLETKLKKLWADVLEIPITTFTTEQTFSNLGGDSFSLALLETKINNELLLISPINVTMLSSNMTINLMAQTISQFLKQECLTTPANFFSSSFSNTSPTSANPQIPSKCSQDGLHP